MMNTYHQKDHHLQGINGYLVMALSVNAVQQQQQPYQLRKVIYSYLQQVFRIVIVGVDDAVLVEYSKAFYLAQGNYSVSSSVSAQQLQSLRLIGAC